MAQREGSGADASGVALKACQMSAEISAVLAVMRQTSKWASSVPSLVQDAPPEDPLVLDLKTLRKDVLTWTPQQWASLPPITYLAPFLHVIASAKTNTVVTGVALASLHKILSLNFFSEDTYGAAEAMHLCVAALTSCHFEIVDGATEESVLLRILQVLLVLMRCKARRLLSDRDVCAMVNTCFRVLQQHSLGSDILQRAAVQTLLDMVREVFAQLPRLPASGIEEGLPEEESAEGMLTPLASSTGEELTRTRSSSRRAEPVEARDPPAEEKAELMGGQDPQAPTAADDDAGAGDGAVPSDSHAEQQGSGAVQVGDGVGEGDPGVNGGGAGEKEVEQDQGGVRLGEALEEPEEAPKSLAGRPHGTACMVEILLYLCMLLDPDYIAQQQAQRSRGFLAFAGEKDEDETALLPLSLVAAALELAGPAVGHHPRLLIPIQDNLFRALLYHGLSSNLLVLSQVFTLVFNLHATLRQHLKLQLESFFSCVLLRLALGPKHGATYLQQEAALEALADFCLHPAFVSEMYANYDCEITCTNSFEEVATMLSRTAIPVNTPLTTTNVLALEALLNVLASLSRRTGGGGDTLPPSQQAAELDLTGDSFWTSVPEHARYCPCPSPCWVEFVQRKKFIKRRLLIGADHFNRDPKKGVQFLQSIGLFPTPLTARSVASFFRYTPGLSKLLVGDYLGDHDPFKVEVLQEFVHHFDFRELPLDAALRTFLESFRLPGEAQKISRVLEAFAEHYFEQCPGFLANKDTAYILAYSLIMLNTDQHNGQVKKKMTEEEFIRNNRKINDGKDLPREMLSELYHSIARNEIRITADSSSRAYHEMTYSLWMDLLRRSSSGTPYLDCATNSTQLLDRDVFVLIASPSIAAISVVFDNTEDEVLLRRCAEGFMCLGSLCAAFGLGDLLDNVVISACKFISLLNPGALPEEPAVTFGEDLKARLAAVTVFSIANQHGDLVRAAWRNILDCIVRLHKLGLLPGAMIAEVEDVPASTGEPRSATNQISSMARTPSGLPSTLAITSPHIMGRKKQAAGLISRWSQFLLSEATEDEAVRPTERQAAAQQKAASTISECRVGNIFSRSHELQPAALQQLASSLVWAAGRPVRGAGAGSVEDEDTAVFCLDLLFVVTIANKQRAMLLWPVLSDCLAAIIKPGSGPGPLVERAVIGLLRTSQKVEPQLSDTEGEEALRAVQLVRNLSDRAADMYYPRIAREVKALVCSACDSPGMRSAAAWRSVCPLLAAASHHPDAFEAGLEALSFVMANSGAHVTTLNLVPCLDAAREFASAQPGGPETSKKALDLVGALVGRLEQWKASGTIRPLSPNRMPGTPKGGGATTPAVPSGTEQAPAADSKGEQPQLADADGAKAEGSKAALSESQLADVWLRLAQALLRVCSDEREEVRTYAVFWLQRCLLAGDTLGMPVTVWGPCFDQVIFVLMNDLVEASQHKKFKGAEGTLQAAVKLLSKVFLHFLPQLSSLPGPGFRALWFGVLSQIDRALKAGRRSEPLQETVTELLKNLLVVMRANGVLANTPDDPDSMWEQTWKMVRAMQPTLRPEVVEQTALTQAPAAAPGEALAAADQPAP